MPKPNRQTRLDYEITFAAETRKLPLAHKQALLVELRRRRRQPAPARTWWIVHPTGGKRRL